MSINIENLLQTVSQEIKALEIARQRYAQELAPDFSVFNYIYTDEIMLSRMIADLLNPKGEHAQGDLFLNLFLSQFSEIPDFEQLNIPQARVSTEVLTFRSQTQRRMDIYIEIPYLYSSKRFGLCIENKPYAADQENQLADYAKELELLHPEQHWHIVYLSGSDNDPSTFSVSTNILNQWKDNNLYTKLHYPALILWLKHCKAQAENEKVSSFLTAFSTFIQKQFLRIEDMSESKQIKDLVLQNQTSLQAAFSISASLNLVKEHLIVLLIQQFNHICEEKKWAFIDFGMKAGGTYCGFEIKFQQDIPNIGIGLEFQKFGHNMPIIGTWTKNLELKDTELNSQIFDALGDLFTLRARSSKHWPFYIDLAINDTEMWLQIQSGEFAEKLIQYFEKIEAGLKKLHST